MGTISMWEKIETLHSELLENSDKMSEEDLYNLRASLEDMLNTAENKLTEKRGYQLKK